MLVEIKKYLDDLHAKGALKEFYACGKLDEAKIEIRGKTLIDFSSWDVLGLNKNKTIIKTLHQAFEEYGAGSSASRLTTGTAISHLTCEKRIAGFFGGQSSLLFSSKNQSVFSFFHSFVKEGDAVFFDEQMLSPIVDACLLTKSRPFPFNSNNLESFEIELGKNKITTTQFLFVESVSPTSGKIVNLTKIIDLCNKHQINLVVDESYALAHYGLRGAGVVDSLAADCLSLNQPFVTRYGSLSYCLPCTGAFIVGDALLMTNMIQKSRTFVNETSISPALATVIEKSLDIIELAQTDRIELSSRVKTFRDELSLNGFLEASESTTPIVSLLVGLGETAAKWHELLLKKGHYVEPLIFKGANSDIGVIRIIITTSHTREELLSLCAAICDIANRMLKE
jgi:7-keto-8-aminopelargonate synthetase-like enzyme